VEEAGVLEENHRPCSRKRNEQKNIYLLRLFVEKYMPTRSKLSFPSKTLFIYKPQIHIVLMTS
jgi:hypothetical protein